MNSSYILELTQDEIQQMEQIASKLIHINPLETPKLFCEKAKELSKRIPFRIQNTLNNFYMNSNDGFLIMKTFPPNLETLVLTPESNTLSLGSSTLIARIQSLFLSLLGEIISYEAEGNGNLFQDIVPVPNTNENQTSYSSNIELEIHTEQAFSKVRPDFLSLACLRGDEKAITYLLPLQKIIDNISEQEYKLLFKPLWKIGMDLSFQQKKHQFLEGNIRGPIPILMQNGENSKPSLVFDQDLMNGITDEANKIKKKIVDIYNKHRISYNLQSGEILLIDNRYVLHGRSKFIPKYDGKDRFLIRCFAVLNYEETTYARPFHGRMVSAIYS